MMFSSMELIIISSCIGIIISRTSLLERLKIKLLTTKFKIIVEGMDCSLCSSFWCSVLLNFIFFTDLHDVIVNSFASALLGYFVGKESYNVLRSKDD